MLKLLETTVSLGLAKPLTVCQITDLHLIDADERDCTYRREHAESRKQYFANARKNAEEIHAHLLERKPDLLLLTGDILDFPTESNLDALRAFLSTLPCPYLYIPGNHDWTFPQDYQSDEQYETNLPRFGEWMGGATDFQILEIGGVAFIGVDDSRFDRVTEKQTEKLEAALTSCRMRGIPAVVCVHVPICSKALAPRATSVWKAPVMLGQANTDAATKRFCELTAAYASAVIAGHVHFTNDGPLDNSGCTQYVTGLAASGTLRTFRFV